MLWDNGGMLGFLRSSYYWRGSELSIGLQLQDLKKNTKKPQNHTQYYSGDLTEYRAGFRDQQPIIHATLYRS